MAERIRAILKLEVKDADVHWTLEKYSDSASQYEKCDDRHDKLNLDERQRELIANLVDLQQFLANVLADTDLPEDQRREVDKRVRALAKVLGESLYVALFRGALHESLLEQLAVASKEPLRIELRFDGHDGHVLSGWPWEYLYVPDERQRAQTRQFLAKVSQLVLTRTMVVCGGSSQFATVRPRVLLIVAGPRGPGIGPVVCSSIVDELQKFHADEIIELKKLVTFVPEKGVPTEAFEATRANFQSAVKDWQPHVIHFVGHGHLRDGKGQLAFVGEQGAPDWEPNFADVSYHADLRLVFLQACESALPDPHRPMSDIAQQLAHRGVPAVVAMQARISNDHACVFAGEFYRLLADSAPVDYAAACSRATLNQKMSDQKMSDDNLAFGVPVVYLHRYGPLISRKAPDPARITGKDTGQKPILAPASYRCPSATCGKVFKKVALACIHCGADLQWPCLNPTCHKPLDQPDEANFCGSCKARVDRERLVPEILRTDEFAASATRKSA